MTKPVAMKIAFLVAALSVAQAVWCASAPVGAKTSKTSSSRTINASSEGENVDGRIQPDAQDDLLAGKDPRHSRSDSTKRKKVRTRLVPKVSYELSLESEPGIRAPESIDQVVRNHLGGWRYSYQKALSKTPTVAGDLAIRFTIAPRGDIVDIDVVNSTTKDPDLDQELLDKTHRMRFDQIDKGLVTAVCKLSMRSE